MEGNREVINGGSMSKALKEKGGENSYFFIKRLTIFKIFIRKENSHV
jgi:hypothetical protein